MMIIGCDLHTRCQQIALLDTETGELVERRLEHESGEARAFYSGLQGPVRVGIEATGYTHWFEDLLAEFGHELWTGDAAKIRASVVRKQKTDARGTRCICSICCARIDFLKSGGHRRRSGICGSWSGTGKSWCGCGER